MLTAACMAHPQDEANPQPQSIYAKPAIKSGFKKATRYHGINAPDGQLKDSLDRLEREANAGDSKAAASVYAGLVACKTMSLSTVKIDFNNRCAGVSDAEMAASGQWIEQAAREGNPAAQYVYASTGFEEIVGKDVTSDAGKSAYQNYVVTARKYLNDLSHQCNVDAINQISRDAWSGGSLFGGRDAAATAYTYAVIYTTVGNADNSDKLLAALEGKLSPSDNAAQLRQSAESFVHQYCQ